MTSGIPQEQEGAAGTAPGEVSRLLRAWCRGDRDALERLSGLVYGELRALAARKRRREGPGGTLQTTALVNELFLRLVGQGDASWENREQFFAVCAKLMRRILVDQARRRRAQKRGGNPLRITLGDVPAGRRAEVDVLWLDEALRRLGAVDPRQARIVELRFFSGMSVEEVGQTLGFSPTTVKREWRAAKEWLRGALSR